MEIDTGTDERGFEYFFGGGPNSQTHMGADFFPEGERMPQKILYRQKWP